MLVFEDIHWADTSLLDLIEVLTARTQDVRLLIVALDAAGALRRPAGLGRRAHLGDGAVARAARRPARPTSSRHSCSGRGDGDYAERLAATAEGNPLFIEELAAVVVERRCRRRGRAPDDDPEHPRGAPRRARAGRDGRFSSMPPWSARCSGVACSSEAEHRSVGIARAARCPRGARVHPARGRLADPGRAAVLVQARAHPPGRVRVGSAGAPARAPRDRGALPRGGDDRDRCVGGDPRISLARGRRRRARGDVLHCSRRPRRARLGEGARGRALQRGVPAATGGRRAPARRRSASARSPSRRCTTCRTRRASRAGPSSSSSRRRALSPSSGKSSGVTSPTISWIQYSCSPSRARARGRSLRPAPRRHRTCRPCRSRRRRRGCAPTRFPGMPRPTFFDFVPILGISVSVTLNLRTIKYLGIRTPPIDPCGNDSGLVARDGVVDQGDGRRAKAEHERQGEQRPPEDVVPVRQFPLLVVHRTSTAIATNRSAR